LYGLFFFVPSFDFFSQNSIVVYWLHANQRWKQKNPVITTQKKHVSSQAVII